MQEVLKKLLTLQECDRHVTRLERDLKDIPNRRRQIDERIKAREAAALSVEAELKKKQSALKQLEVEVETIKGQVAKYRQQQFEVKTNESYKALDHEIAAANLKISQVEDRELEHMEGIEAAKAQVAEAQAIFKKDAQGIEAEKSALDEQSRRMASEIEQLRTDRTKLLDGIPPDVLARYQRILANKGDFALVHIENGICGGCHMKLPPQTYQDVRRGAAVCTCTFCGRMLY